MFRPLTPPRRNQYIPRARVAHRTTTRFLHAAILCAGMLAGPAAFAQTTLYSSSFGSGSSGFTTTGAGALRTDNGITYLGNLGQGATASLALNTAGYTNLHLAFTLYGVLSLDGNGPAGGGPDPFLIGDHSGTIFNYTFANYTGGNTQSYGGAGQPAGSYAPRTGEASCGDLGFGCGDYGDATYLFSNLLLTPGTGGALTLTFTGNTNESLGNEFYGINNVVITGTALSSTTTPEPSTWVLLGTGLAGMGAAARRRRNA